MAVMVAVGVLGLGAVEEGAVSASTGGANLAVALVSSPPATKVPGQSFHVSDTTVNRGHSRAPASITRYYLSKTRALGGFPIPLGKGRQVPSLGAGKRSRGSAEAQVPLGAPTAVYYLLACAAVGQSGLGQGCAVAARRIRLIPHPMSVSPVLESTHAVTGTVSSASGGTLSTVGADGTMYTLSIPAGALLGPEQITLTPIRSIAGTGLSQPVLAGADLEPSGLVLTAPATLTIKPAKPIPLSRQHGFAFEGSGQDFRRYPLALTTSQIEFQLVHFSGVDLGNGSVLQINTVERSVPDVAIEQPENANAGPTEQIRLGDNSEAGLITELETWYFNNVVVPDLKEGEGSDTAAQRAFLESVGWERDVVLYGLSTEKVFRQALDFVHTEWVTIAVNAYKRAYDRCRRNDHPRQAQITMLQMVRWLEVHGADPAQQLGSDYLVKIRKCLGDYLVSVDITTNGRATSSVTGLGAYGFLRAGGHGTGDDGLRPDGRSQPNGPVVFSGTAVLDVNGLTSTPPPNDKCGTKLGPVSSSAPLSSFDAFYEPDTNLGIKNAQKRGIVQVYFRDEEDVTLNGGCGGRQPHAWSVLQRGWYATENPDDWPSGGELKGDWYSGRTLTRNLTGVDSTQGQNGTWTVSCKIMVTPRS